MSEQPWVRERSDQEDTIRWLAEQLDLVPDDEPGVWLSFAKGRVLRLPEHLDATLKALLIDGDVCE